MGTLFCLILGLPVTMFCTCCHIVLCYSWGRCLLMIIWFMLSAIYVGYEVIAHDVMPSYSICMVMLHGQCGLLIV